MAEKQISFPSDIKSFDRLNYKFSSEFSTENDYVFLREKEALK
jgi:cytoplasmic iron level regulating protein YaaA (DUF328/UPF0246 family)